ncbi:MAG: tetratricopeptide repeat protein [Deltaproteobacteria bacterium]|nr:tetratricopeptide repeat protein [Deltaproteobacteria bacterium]
MTRWWAGVFVCILAMAVTGWASAQAGGDGEAKAAFEKGKALFHEGKYTEAAGAFREADRLKPTWKLLYNIGQCEAARKAYGQAIEAFERYLAEGGDVVEPERRDAVLAELDRMRKMVGGVKVKAPAGTQVLIDGEERGRAPLGSDIAVTAGVEHDIRLVKDGKELLAVKQSVRGGAVIEVEATEPKAEPAVASVAQPEPESGKNLSPGPSPSGRGDRVPEISQGGRGLSPLWFWIGLGATGAFGAVAVAMNFAVEDRKDDITTQVKMDETERFQNTGIAFIALAGAAAVTTAIVASFTDFSVYSDEGAPKVSAWVAPGGGGVAVGKRF